MNAAAILAIPETEPERLFRQHATISADFKTLLKRWHPDVNPDPDASRVAAHIGALYQRVLKQVKDGAYNPPGWREITGRDGRSFKIKFLARRSFELGEMLIGTNIVTFLIDRKHEDLVINGLRHIGQIRYPNETFRKSITPYMPHVARSVETSSGCVIVMRKEPHEVLLSDLIEHLGGRIEPKHAAWIISSLLNLACFLEVEGMTVNGLMASTIFVSPKQHSASLYGGWWYAAGAGKLLRALPPETHSLASRRLLAHKVAQHDLDLTCIKAIGRACLGDPNGGGLRARSDVPAPITQFLQMPAGKSAFVEYERWPKVLEDSFGPRRYHELKVTGEDVYPEGN